MNNWYFGCVFDHNKFGWQSFINLWFIDKEVFHYESQRVKSGYCSMLHVMTRPKFWLARKPTSKQNLVIIYKLHIIHQSKIPETWLISKPYQISHKSFDQEKPNNRKVTFHNTHCPLKSWNTRTSNFWTICILTIQKHWQR